MGCSKILVVDDDPSVLELMTEIFVEAGYDVRSAADGQSALAKVAEWLPLVVLTDIVMPSLNGDGLAKAIRSRFPQVAVILTSANRPELSGLDIQFLPKPFSVEEAIGVVRQAIVEANTFNSS